MTGAKPGPSDEPGERTALLAHRPASSETLASSVSDSKARPAVSSHASSFDDSVSTDASFLADLEADDPARPTTPPPASPKTDVNVAAVVRVVSVLMIGVFVSNLDGSLILATHPIIASEFNDFESSSWLFGAFVLASAATQTMYGKLSDIYGRKSLVLVSYAFFTGGCALVGAGQSMLQVILGRAISGAGSAGMVALVSILISDLLPIRDVASWRAYVNVAATTGRSLGGPVGGWLADMVGWRWSFVGQVPFMLLATLLCALYLPGNTHHFSRGHLVHGEPTRRSAWDQLRRVDFLGSALLALTLLAFLLPIEMGGVKVPWSHPILPTFLAASAVLLFLFVRIEKRAAEPIVPLEMFRIRDANLAILMQVLQGAAQMGLMFSVPIYFKVSANVSNTEAGAHLFPAVAGNAIGGILTGLYIKKTGRYRNMIIAAALSSMAAYVALLLRWHGHTNWLESLYIFPGGFGMGIVQSAVFIALQVVVDSSYLASAISILFVSGTCSMIIGITCVSTVMQVFLKWGLSRRLIELGLDAAQRADIISKSLSNIDYVPTLSGAIKAAVVDSYVEGLWWSHAVSLLFSSLALFCALLLGEKPLKKVEAEEAEEST